MKKSITSKKSSENDMSHQLDAIKKIMAGGSVSHPSFENLSQKQIDAMDISTLEGISLEEFNSMSRESQAKILIKYSKIKKVLNTAQSYYRNNSDCTLDKENFQGILDETISKVLNKVEESKNQLNSNTQRASKSLNTQTFEFKTVKDIFGYMTNAFKNNVKKNYVPHTTQKRKNATLISISPNDLNSDQFGSLENILPNKELVEDFIDQHFYKSVDKKLMEFDKNNSTNLSKVFRELLVNENHSHIAKSFKISNHQLSKITQKIHDVLKTHNLLEGLSDTLLSQIKRKEDLMVAPNYKDSEMASNINFGLPKYDLVHCVGTNFKTKNTEVMVSIYEIVNNKKTKLTTESVSLKCQIDDEKVARKINEIKMNLTAKYQQQNVISIPV